MEKVAGSRGSFEGSELKYKLAPSIIIFPRLPWVSTKCYMTLNNTILLSHHSGNPNIQTQIVSRLMSPLKTLEEAFFAFS